MSVLPLDAADDVATTPSALVKKRVSRYLVNEECPVCEGKRLRRESLSVTFAGRDMAEMSRFTPFEAYDFAQLGQSVFAMIEKLPCITVAVIDGDCFGGALDLALAFDLRYATPRSRFSHPGAKLGIVTGFGGTTRWRKAMTPAAARRLFLANEVLSAADAHAIGLVDGIGEPDLARLEA